ncbi:hypothetical protein RFI_28099 [Reticulomyxa filosa]|uniref:Uncharacterized protein n=1 Tax=Reticulomyxa filosa TaxID=46433 RepID=X6M5L9_RETFI|nr:hypothetical protein RFI_28099 [Reticulomyxa filosa]|eukprot:ETO09288.1 hypothetical protein RFI_28099 [Reticulomyxa filosa]
MLMKNIIKWLKMKLNVNCIWSFDINHSDITREEVIEALRHLSPCKAQGPDNINDQMLKNGGNAMIDSLANIVHIPKPDRDHRQCKNNNNKKLIIKEKHMNVVDIAILAYLIEKLINFV